LAWHLSTDRQIWIQLEEILSKRILSGQYAVGSRLPSVRELAQEAGVNPNTMQRALQSLEEHKLVATQGNTGKFVTEDPEVISRHRKAAAQKEVRSYYASMKALGLSEEEAKKFFNEKEDAT